MSRAKVPLAILAATLASGALASERVAVIAVGDPPYGPDADLAELAHQVRAACRDRVGGVDDVPTLRARLLGQTSNATLSELDRAYGGALAVYQNGEFESALRTLRAVVADLESLPESDDAYDQWKRAMLRLVHVAQTIGDEREVERTLTRLAMTEPTLQPDADQYSPTYRRRFEVVKGKVRALPKRRLQILSEGRPGVVYVNGRAMGVTPITLTLPAGTYRIGGAAGALRVPSFLADLEAEDRMVVLDFALAEALRVNAGPGLALPAAQRAYGIIRAGAWLGADKLVVASRVDEGGAQFLLGSIYDVRRGALLREGSVRMVAGSVPSVNLGALASFLLTGQSSRDVKDRTRDAPREVVPPAVAAVHELPAAQPPAPVPAAISPAPAARAEPPPAPAEKAAPPAKAPTHDAAASTASPAVAALAPAPPAPAAPAATPAALDLRPGAVAAPAPGPLAASARGPARGWMRGASIGAGVAALALGALAVQQGLSASKAYRDADAMLSGDVLLPGSDVGRYNALRRDGENATRNAYISAGVAAACAATAGVLGWKAWMRPGTPTVGVVF